MDCPDKIPPSGTPAWHAETTPLVDVTDQHLGIIVTPGIPTGTIETGTDSVNLDLTHITPRYRSISHSDSCRSHSRSFHQPSCHSSSCHRSSSTYCYCTVTHHIADPHHAEISPEMIVDPEHINQTGTTTNLHRRSSSSSQSTPWKPKDRRNKQVTIDDPPSKYYSPDEQDSDSQDDLN